MDIMIHRSRRTVKLALPWRRWGRLLGIVEYLDIVLLAHCKPLELKKSRSTLITTEMLLEWANEGAVVLSSEGFSNAVAMDEICDLGDWEYITRWR